MSEHAWETEEVDGGPVGVCDFWRCRRCDAAGGPCWPAKDGSGYVPKKRGWVFYADGSGLKLTDDCEESDRLIREHFRKRVMVLVAEGFKREIAVEFGVADSTVDRWVSGIACPLPRMRKVVIDFCRKLIDKQAPAARGKWYGR